MGRRGPKKTPTETKRRRGTYRADRDAGVELPAVATLDPPEWLSPEARQEWDRLCPLLATYDLLSAVDAIAFGLLCQAVADYVAATKLQQRVEPIVYTEKGYPLPHPAIGVANKHRDALLRLAREFGLTPSARSGLQLSPGDRPVDPLAQHMGGSS